MKKLYTLKKFREWNKVHAEESLTRKLNFKRKKKAKNVSELGLNTSQRKDRNKLKDYFKDYTHVHAPENLSFIDNADEVIEFINNLKHEFDKRNQVFVVLKNVKRITYDAIVVLLSIMVKFKSKKISFNGSYPLNINAKKILKQSQFLKYLYEDFDEADRYNLERKNSIHTHAWKNVDSELGKELIKQASKTVWGEERRCQGVQRTLIELMLNTNNHADDEKRGEKHWWLSVHHDLENNKVSFAFIDFGVGVFSSLSNKKSSSKFYGVIEKARDIFKFNDNAGLLRLILDGSIHKTATNKPYHGKGLPGIKTALERNQISNLNIITNDVHAVPENNIYNKNTRSFSGTFVYWELNQNNTNCHVIN